MSAAIFPPSFPTIPPSTWNQKRIEGTSFTAEWILKTLQAHGLVLDARDVADVSLTSKSNENGFVSQIVHVTFHFKTHRKDVAVVMKIPGVHLLKSASEGSHDQIQVDYFNQEVRFYQCFLPYLNVPLPKIYETVKWVPEGDIGAILMDDLSETCTIQNVCESLSLEQLLDIVDHLAVMHNSFLRLAETQRREFEAAFPPVEGSIDFQVKVIVGKAEEVVQKYPDVFKSGLDKFLDILRDAEYHRYNSASVSEAFGLPRVPVHGDFWSNNILWKNANRSEVGAFVDWQAFFVGSPAFDLSRILTLSTSADVRRAHTDFVIGSYYSKLENASFTKSQLEQAYKETLPYQCAHIVFVVQLLEPHYNKAQLHEMMQRAAAAVLDVQDYEPVYKCGE